MSIFKYLDSEKSGDYCEYNGDLKDYILCLDRENLDYPFFKAILNKCPDVKICLNYRIPIVQDSVSNLIIKYKDVFKLDKQTIVCPYIFYVRDENGQSRAVICADNYFIAKGYYFTATEKDAILADYKNFIVACDKDIDNLNELFDVLLTIKASVAQRVLDNKMFKDYDELYSKILAYNEKYTDEVIEQLDTPKDKAKVIQSAITKWFLLKKTSYVQYMVNKDLLTERHEGDNRSQRRQAKINADNIKFISMNDMWHQSYKNNASFTE